jgi:hypothetical protein
MKVKTHLWTSLVAGGVVGLVTGSGAAMAGTFITGVGIDADHLIDQLWAIRLKAPYMTGASVRLDSNTAGAAPKTGPPTPVRDAFRRRKLLRLPLIFHSYELLAVLAGLLLISRTPFLIGIVTGYALHLLLDLIRHYKEFQSPLFYLFSFRISRGFRRERLIKADYV